MKTNDWLVASINNPDKNLADFIFAGFNTDNTLLLSAEQYKQSEFIKDTFTLDGTFNEKAFTEFYQDKAREFNTLSEPDAPMMKYQPFDPRSNKDNVIRDVYYILKAYNPKEITKDWMGTPILGKRSEREKAQDAPIFDTATGKFREETVNDIALFKNPLKWAKSALSEPLVYATYDSDGTHRNPITGQTEEHKRGEYKMNNEGMPYVETLNGRSLIGKEVVSSYDNLTVDGTTLNKYDFFDADGVSKNVFGTVMRTAAEIAPLFVPYVGEVYSGLLITRELAQAMPMLYGIIDGFSDNPKDNEFINNTAAVASRFTRSMSDKGKESTLNMEVLGGLVSDVALQWGQQKLIAKSISKLRGIDKLAKEANSRAFTAYTLNEKALSKQLANGEITEAAYKKLVGDPTKWYDSALGSAYLKQFNSAIEPTVRAARSMGANAALAYMAIVSNTDVYESMLEAGASQKEAALVTIGSAAGMFAVDKFLHLGEVFFDDLTTASEKLLRRTLTKDADSWFNNTIKNNKSITNAKPENKVKAILAKSAQRGKEKTSEFVENLKYHSLGFWGKAIGEGLEEVSEEIVSDASKGIYEAVGALGFDTQAKDVGAFKDILPRYGMSFLGGAIGGGIFYGVDVSKNKNFKVDKSLDELIYIVRNGKTDEALKALDVMHKKGELGSTNLSMKTTVDSEGNQVFLTADKDNISQNDFVYNRLKESIVSLDSMIKSKLANLSEEELFSNMVLNETRFLALNEYLDLQGLSYSTGYQKEYQTRLNNVLNLEVALKAAKNTDTGLPNGTQLKTDAAVRAAEKDVTTRQENITNLEHQLKQAQNELNDFISGKASLEYMEKLLFAMDSNLSGNFVSMTFNQWLDKNHYGRTVESLSDSEMTMYLKEYLQYKESDQAKDLNEQFNIYKAFKEQLSPLLSSLPKYSESISENIDTINKLLSDNQNIFNEYRRIGYDDVIPENVLDENGNVIWEAEDENSDSYVNRALDVVDLESAQKLENRIIAINAYNRAQTDNLYKALESLVKDSLNHYGRVIDPSVRRYLTTTILNRSKDILKAGVQNATADLQTKTNDQTLINEFKASLNAVIESPTATLDEAIRRLINKTSNYIADKSISELSSQLYTEFKQGFTEDISEEVFANNIQEILFPIIEEQQFGIGSFFEDEEGNTITRTKDEVLQAIAESAKNVTTATDEAAFLIDKVNQIESDEVSIDDMRKLSLLSDFYLDTNEFKSKMAPILSVINNFVNKELRGSYININNLLKSQSLVPHSPITELISKLAFEMNLESKNLESLLDTLEEAYKNIDDIGQITLTASQETAFDEAEFLIDMVLSYLYAATKEYSQDSPFAHNKLLNEVMLNHKDLFGDMNPLLELDPQLASFYLLQLNFYKTQMGILDPTTGKYNIGSWRELSQRNKQSKTRQFLETEKAWNSTLFDLFKYNLKEFICTIDGVEYNLLEGFEEWANYAGDIKNNTILLNKLLDTFYKNYNNLRQKTTLSDELIFKSLNLVGEGRMLNAHEVSMLTTSILDTDIRYDRLTDFDKLMIICTAASLESTEFYKYLSTRIEAEKLIVPLTIQEWLTRMELAMISNPDIFNVALAVAKVSDTATENILPILRNTIFIEANGGAGKSRVLAKNAALYHNDGVRPVWLSAPEVTQITTLKEAVGIGEPMLISSNTTVNGVETPSILSRIISADQLSDIKQLDHLLATISFQELEQSPASDKLKFINQFGTIKKDDNGYIFELDAFKINYIKLTDSSVPSLIILDEATYASSAILQILSNFCYNNNSKMILLGNLKQNGFEGKTGSLRREVISVARTPNLALTLRDANDQHQTNMRNIESILNTAMRVDESGNILEAQSVTKQLVTQTKSLNLRCYLSEDDINGDYITDSLPLDLVSKLDGSICYVGDLNSENAKALKALDKDVTFLSPNKVQGQEFDYVIIDKPFNSYMQGLGLVSLIRLYTFLTDFYTMISRCKQGTILIENEAGSITSLVGVNRFDKSKSPIESISAYIGDFMDKKLDIIQTILSKSPIKESTKSENRVTQELSIQSESSEKLEGTNFTPKVEQATLTVQDFDFAQEFYIPVLTDVPDAEQKEAMKSFIALYSKEPQSEDRLFADLQEWVQRLLLSEVTFRIYAFNKNENTSLADLQLDVVEDMNSHLKGLFTVNRESSDYDDRTTELVDEDNTEFPLDVVDQDAESVRLVKQNTAKLYSGNILCYGEGNFRSIETQPGSVVLANGSTKEDGEVWVINRESSYYRNRKRDINIFVKEDESIINSLSRLLELKKKVRQIKECILYKHSSLLLDRGSNKQLFDEESFKKITFKLEFRKKSSTDSFFRNNGLRDKFQEIGPKDKPIIAAVIAVLPDVNGNLCEITLGLLSNPETWLNNNPDNAEARKYKTFIELAANNVYDNENDEPYVVDNIPSSAFNTNALTDIHNNTDENDEEDLTVRPITRMTSQKIEYLEAELRSMLNEQDPYRVRKQAHLDKLKQLQKSELSFRRSNPDTIISPMYVTTHSNKGMVSNKLIGLKAVIFVTNDSNLDPSKLASIWIQQQHKRRANTENMDASVRMIVLDSIGLSFDDLNYTANRKLLSTTTDSGRDNQFPFKSHYAGVRMYTALWNFRANLTQFMLVLNNNSTATDKDINDELNKLGIKQFRVKNDIKTTNGAIIGHLFDFENGVFPDSEALKQKYDVSTNPNMIYINKETAELYLELINHIFNKVIDPIVSIKFTDTNDTQVTKLRQLSTSTKTKFANSLSGHISDILKNQKVDTKYGQILAELGSVFDDFNGVTIPQAFSRLPLILSKFYKNILIYGNTLNGIYITSDIVNNLGNSLLSELDYYLSQELYNKLFIEREDKPLANHLSNFFNFAFHGTVENIHSKNTLKASDALFPNGFYVDPIGASKTVKDGQEEVFREIFLNTHLFGTNVHVGYPTFFMNLEAVSDAKDSSARNILTPMNNVVTDAHRGYVELQVPLGTTLEEAKNIASSKLSLNMEQIINNTTSGLSSEIFDIIIQVSDDGKTFTTLKEKLEAELLIFEPSVDLDSITLEGNHITYKLTDGTIMLTDIDLNAEDGASTLFTFMVKGKEVSLGHYKLKILTLLENNKVIILNRANIENASNNLLLLEALDNELKNCKIRIRSKFSDLRDNLQSPKC